ncbi:MAG: hypothetical protein NTU71_10190 [Verrucomicrobia bacterium]|nr:hypothetical protein [Verrucomicrobiota bacterium]
MKDFLVRRPLLIGLVMFALVWAAFTWLTSGTSEGKAPGQPAVARGTNKPGATRPAVGTPRSANGLVIDAQHDISADGRPPDARRESIVRAGIGELQEIKQMNLAVFDDAAKRWNAQPRVKELVAQWQATEAAWKTQDDDAKAAVVPQMEAMWKEALGLLREEVEKSAREAAAGVK